MFVTTRASDYVIKCLQKNSCVTLTAPAGVGKSFIARHTALVLQKEQYKILPVYSPTDIRDYYQPGKQAVFIIDDICGNIISNHPQIENWKQLLPIINTIIDDKHCKVIVCCRLEVYKDDKFNILSPFISCECNLISDDLVLTTKEKRIIANMYIGTKSTTLYAIAKHFDFFPLLCYLFHEKKDADVEDFFRNPFGVYKNELDHLDTYGDVGKHNVCSVLFNKRRHVEKYFQGKITDEQRQIIEDKCKTSRLNRSTSNVQFKGTLDTLEMSFKGKQNDIYISIHKKMFDFIVHYFGQKMIQCLIEHDKKNIIGECLIWQKSSNDREKNIDFIIEIPDDYLDSNSEMPHFVLNNANVEVSAFRQQVLQHCLQLNNSKEVALTNTKDTDAPRKTGYLFYKEFKQVALTSFQHAPLMTPLLSFTDNYRTEVDPISKSTLFKSCLRAFNFILRSAQQGNNQVDLCCFSCFTPLYVALHCGHIDIVKMLLFKSAYVDVDMCFNCGLSSFLRSKQNNNIDVLMMMAEKNPDDGICILNGGCPLTVACEQGHTDIVRMLLEKNHIFDPHGNEGITALLIASWKGNTTIVNMLLEKNINIEECNENGFSSLLMASQYGHTDIVTLLLERNPNVDVCTTSGRSPLLMASTNGHTGIVRLLLESNSNINLCNKQGCSPLRMASQNGHIDTVSMLLERKPNVDLCDIDGCSPLHIATEKGHTDIVRILLENYPNVDLCTNDGVTALLISCCNGYTSIVSMLLENNSNVNLCNKNRCSPLYIASQNGQAAIVSMLLDKNPNVDLCNKNGCSPLYIASQNGHTAIVRLLLDRKANDCICNNNGLSPLYIASQNGHTDIVRLLLNRP